VSDGREAAPATDGDETLSGRSDEESTRQGTTVTTAKEPEGPIVVSPSVYRRLMSGLPSFTMAMLACLVVVGLVILITPSRNEGAMPRADYQGDLSGLRAIAPYQVLAPQGLPPQWYPTSTRLNGHTGGPVSWHLGFYTPQKEYAALEESNETPDGAGNFIDRMTSQGHPDGTAQVAGATWARTFRPDKKQRSLVRRLPGMTLVLTGTASYEELAVLAGSLKPQPKPSAAVSPTR
jgi:hypothetical protein